MTWNVECGVMYKHEKYDRLYESWNGSTRMERKGCSDTACWEGSHSIE
jgi:hypothetical protein